MAMGSVLDSVRMDKVKKDLDLKMYSLILASSFYVINKEIST